jgi:hypothetical protein
MVAGAKFFRVYTGVILISEISIRLWIEDCEYERKKTEG